MQMYKVISSNIDSIGYDTEKKELYVRFKSGKDIYIYEDVSEGLNSELMASDSKGSFISKNFVKTEYKFRKERIANPEVVSGGIK